MERLPRTLTRPQCPRNSRHTKCTMLESLQRVSGDFQWLPRICSDFRQRFTSVLLILRAANDRLLIRMRGRIGKALKSTARIPFLKTIHALAAQSRYTLVPCEKHSLADILKSGVACHRFSHPRCDI